MISREELKKMMKKNEIVWIPNKIGLIELELDQDWKIEEGHDIIYHKITANLYTFKELYKTEKEAEWVSKTHIKRYELFEPPMWEKFQTLHNNYFPFMSKTWCYCYIYIKDNKLIVFDSDCDYTYFKGKPTEENYTKAVEIAQKLFLGKENEL